MQAINSVFIKLFFLFFCKDREDLFSMRDIVNWLRESDLVWVVLSENFPKIP